MQPARHEALRAVYEHNAAKNPEEWKNWQYKGPHGPWYDCRMPPIWHESTRFRRKPTGHVHAELMAQYAEDAKTSPEPWVNWERRSTFAAEQHFHPLAGAPTWDPHSEYRRKPEPQVETHPYTITCTMVINATDSDDAAWQFREAVASGVQPVQWVDDCGVIKDKCGVRQ